MKKTLSILLLAIGLLGFATFANTSNFNNDEVEPKYLTEDSFDKAINTGVVIVEFVASFAEPFGDWQKIKDGEYYRVDIEKAPKSKKKYRIRMAPSILIFKDGIIEESFKAGLDLELPTDLQELQETIDETKQATRY